MGGCISKKKSKQQSKDSRPIEQSNFNSNQQNQQQSKKDADDQDQTATKQKSQIMLKRKNQFIINRLQVSNSNYKPLQSNGGVKIDCISFKVSKNIYLDKITFAVPSQESSFYKIRQIQLFKGDNLKSLQRLYNLQTDLKIYYNTNLQFDYQLDEPFSLKAGEIYTLSVKSLNIDDEGLIIGGVDGYQRRENKNFIVEFHNTNFDSYKHWDNGTNVKEGQFLQLEFTD